MSSASFKLDNNTPHVTWANPKASPDPAAASQNVSTKQLKELFRRHGEVTKVVMPPGKVEGKRNFGFIHYAERSSALKAIKESEKYEIEGTLPGIIKL
ncbi:hypothetical protein RIF29_20956 [Crotalaria pallida]|uniref:RRM domain-containing protein n=1 Tax=Crotalaria pallida TaxID=3830 RepID=A0AAN9F5M5_CROPI